MDANGERLPNFNIMCLLTIPLRCRMWWYERPCCQLIASAYLLNSSDSYILWSLTSDDVRVRNRPEVDSLMEKPVEKETAVSGRPTVESESKLVEVVGHMLAFYAALVSAQQPALQERCDTVDARQKARAVLPLPANSDTVLIADLLKVAVGIEAVSDNGRAWGNHSLHKSQQARRGRIFHSLQPDSTSGGSAAHFRGNCHQYFLADMAPARSSLKPADEGLVDFHAARQSISARTDHRSSQFMQPSPRSLVTAESKYMLKAERAGSVLLRSNPPDSVKPRP